MLLSSSKHWKTPQNKKPFFWARDNFLKELALGVFIKLISSWVVSVLNGVSERLRMVFYDFAISLVLYFVFWCLALLKNPSSIIFPLQARFVQVKEDKSRVRQDKIRDMKLTIFLQLKTAISFYFFESIFFLPKNPSSSLPKSPISLNVSKRCSKLSQFLEITLFLFKKLF